MKYIVLLALLWIGCASTSPQQQAYLASLESDPLTFMIPRDSLDAVHARAKWFLLTYSSGRIFRETSAELEGTPLAERIPGYYYLIRFYPRPDSIDVEIICETNEKINEAFAKRNAHIVANYLRTSEIPYKDLIHH